ncbi:MAG: ribonuclease HI, partial [Chloroflexi bacterium]|nr:ribonuclease HI [Chloroflexota bacterium]
MADDKPQVTIYTDGGAKPNPGPGGWGVVLIVPNGYTKEHSGSAPDTTNNQMELTAAIEALRALKEPSAVTLHTDSEYLKNGITRWLRGWVRDGWLTSKDEPVKNQELWQALHAETQR